ncbi:NADPH-dependent F420 reductase [Dryocola clanedunensis]
MKIAVIGTGMVGRAIAHRLNGLGHDAVIGTRDPQATMARTEPDPKGTAPFAQWHVAHPQTRLVTMAEAGAHGEIIVNATGGAESIAALNMVGRENLAGKILLDLALPLDLSGGWPPRLLVANDDSLGEQIQRAFPESKIVKSLTTIQFEVMIDPTIVPGRHHVFVSGNDDGAKSIVSGLLQEFGWTAGVIIDLGDITTSRAVEMYSRLLFTMSDVFGDFHTNIMLVRPQK